MRKYRVIKIVVALTLTVAIVLCSSVFVSAYYPLWSCYSSDWVVATDEVYSAVYPVNSIFAGLHESVLQYEDLFEDTYYMSKYWDDEYEAVITGDDVYIPELPDVSEFSAFGYDLSEFATLFYSSGNNFYFDCYFGVNDVYVDDNGYLMYDVEDCTGEVLCFELCYPYDEWTLHSSTDFYGDTNVVAFSADIEGGLSVVNVIEWGASDIFGRTITHTYTTPISCLTGSLYCVVDSESYKKLSNSLSALLFQNFGFIIGTDTDFLDFSYSLTVNQDGEYQGSEDFFHYQYNSTNSNILSVGTKAITSEIQILDFINQDLNSSDVELVFTFSFASSGYNLFFPGSIELVEYASYEETKQHEEVISAINGGFDKIMNEKLDMPTIVIDTSELDNVVQEQEEIIDGVYEDTDKLIEDNLPDGYEDYNDYLSDNIKFFNENISSAFAFIKKLYERVVDVTGQSYLILFCLSFGFAMYVLGRRLS